MNPRPVFVVLAAVMLALGATTPATRAATRGELHVGLRIGERGASDKAIASPAEYDVVVRQSLLESGTPRDLALAALPSRLTPHETPGATRDLLLDAAARAPDDVLVQWLASVRGLAMHDDAGAATAIAALTRLEPDNAAAWTLALSLATARGDDRSIDAALARVATATRANDHVADLLQAWLAVYEMHPRPLSAFANPAEAATAPFVDAIAKATAAAPSYRPLVDACAASADTARAADCAAAGRLLLHRATSLPARDAGFAMLRGVGDAVTPLDTAARRELAWIAANEERVSGFSDLDGAAIAAHREDWRALADEREIVLRAMRRAGVSEAAPADWMPGRTSGFARAGGG